MVSGHFKLHHIQVSEGFPRKRLSISFPKIKSNKMLALLAFCIDSALSLHLQEHQRDGPVLVSASSEKSSVFIVSDCFTGLKEDSSYSAEKSLISLGSNDDGLINWHMQQNQDASAWSSFVIAKLPHSQHADTFDVNGDGYPDLIVSHNYGGCPTNCSSTYGNLSWLENPKGKFGVPWPVHPIAKPAFASHRVAVINKKAADRSLVRLVSIPISGWWTPGNDSGDPFMTPFQITSFALPSSSSSLASWNWKSSEQIIADTLNLCHEGKEFLMNGQVGLGLSCLQGGLFLAFAKDETTGKDSWILHQVINPVPFNTTRAPMDHPYNYNGLSSMAQCMDGKQQFLSFIAPFHDGRIGVAGFQGRPPVLIDDIPGVGHDIRCSKLSPRDTVDSIIVSFRKNSTGLFAYSYSDEQGQWIRRQLSNSAANFIAIADFNGDGREDVATVDFGGSDALRPDSNIEIFFQ